MGRLSTTHSQSVLLEASMLTPFYTAIIQRPDPFEKLRNTGAGWLNRLPPEPPPMLLPRPRP